MSGVMDSLWSEVPAVPSEYFAELIKSSYISSDMSLECGKRFTTACFLSEGTLLPSGDIFIVKIPILYDQLQ